MPNNNYILALDVGGRRIGVAIASLVARLSRPLLTLEHSGGIFTRLQELIASEHVGIVVVGLPRGVNGQVTAQTTLIETFIEELKSHLDMPVYAQDEALTSVKAETELDARGKAHSKGDVDALSATYILEDFLQEHPEAVHV